MADLNKIEKACIQGMTQNNIPISKMARSLGRPDAIVRKYAKEYKQILSKTQETINTLVGCVNDGVKAEQPPTPPTPPTKPQDSNIQQDSKIKSNTTRPNKSQIINTTKGKKTQNIAIMTKEGSEIGDSFLQKNKTKLNSKTTKAIFKPKG